MKRNDAISWLESSIAFLKQLPQHTEVEWTVDCPDGGTSLPIELDMYYHEVGKGDQSSMATLVFRPVGPYRFDVFEEENDNE